MTNKLSFEKKVAMAKVLKTEMARDNFKSELSNMLKQFREKKISYNEVWNFILKNEFTCEMTVFERDEFIAEEMKPFVIKEIAKWKIQHLTVGDLKQILEEVPDDLPIAGVGHFGEIDTIDKSDISVQLGYPILKEYGGWREHEPYRIKVFSINMPDFGQGPD
jgi:hypothetical protein